MKFLRFGTLSLLVLFFLACGASKKGQSAKIQTGKVRYAIDLDLEEQAQGMAETFGTHATVWFNSQYLRLQKESTVPNEEFFITTLSTRQERAYLQFKEFRYAVLSDPRLLPGTGPIQFTKVEKSIAGYSCRKATATMGAGEMEVYYSDQLPINYCPFLKDLPGFALEYTLVMPYGKVTYRAEEVELVPLADSMINPPADFEEVSYVEFQKAMMQQAQPSKERREEAFSFKKTDLHGELIDLEALRGEVVVLNFWFGKCPPCKAEIPMLNSLVKRYQNDAQVHFLAPTFDPQEQVEQFVKQNPFSFKIIPDAMQVVQDFEIIAFPTTIVLDKNGKIVHTIVGGAANIEEELAEWIEKAKS